MKKIFALLLVAFTLSGCETLMDLNPLDRRPDPLPGERKEVFPQGVQLDRSVPQPFNPSAPVPTPEPQKAPKISR